MIDFSYLQRGWLGLARSPQAGSMAGHLGASLLAGYYFGEMNPDLDPAIYEFVSNDLDRITAGEEAIWFNPAKSGITVEEMFATGQKDDPLMSSDAAARQIARELTSTNTVLRQSGHNIIFGSLALRALTDHPELATQSTVDGVVRLMKQFRGVRAGRGNFGEAEGWKMSGDLDLSGVEDPAYETVGMMAEVTLDELIAMAQIRTQGFGGLFHLIDHAAALIECRELGFPELTSQGLQAHRQHVKYLRMLPDLSAELGPVKKSTFSPIEPEYWDRKDSSQYSAFLTHRIKVLYGFTVVSGAVEDRAKVAAARDAFQYLMA